jgi:micrococcal nuclease
MFCQEGHWVLRDLVLRGPSVRAFLMALFALFMAALPAWSVTFTATCVSAYDGDTITVRRDGAREKIRLLGIDTPEMGQRPWGLKARDYTRSLVLNKTVRVETDVQPRDRYGRLLGYVYVGNVFVNEAIVRAGHGMLLTYPPNVAHVDTFRAAQTAAQNSGVGIWNRANPLMQSPQEYRRNGRGFGAGRTFSRGAGLQLADPRPAGKGGGGTVSLNQRSRKYHEPSCQYYDCGNCVDVPRAQAESVGVPCKVCH